MRSNKKTHKHSKKLTASLGALGTLGAITLLYKSLKSKPQIQENRIKESYDEPAVNEYIKEYEKDYSFNYYPYSGILKDLYVWILTKHNKQLCSNKLIHRRYSYISKIREEYKGDLLVTPCNWGLFKTASIDPITNLNEIIANCNKRFVFLSLIISNCFNTMPFCNIPIC